MFCLFRGARQMICSHFMGDSWWANGICPGQNTFDHDLLSCLSFCLVACRLLLVYPMVIHRVSACLLRRYPSAAPSAPPRMVSFSCGEIRALANYSFGVGVRRRVAGRWSWPKGGNTTVIVWKAVSFHVFFGRTWCKGILKNLHQSLEFRASHKPKFGPCCCTMLHVGTQLP